MISVWFSFIVRSCLAIFDIIRYSLCMFSCSSYELVTLVFSWTFFFHPRPTRAYLVWFFFLFLSLFINASHSFVYIFYKYKHWYFFMFRFLFTLVCSFRIVVRSCCFNVVWVSTSNRAERRIFNQTSSNDVKNRNCFNFFFSFFSSNIIPFG